MAGCQAIWEAQSIGLVPGDCDLFPSLWPSLWTPEASDCVAPQAPSPAVMISPEVHEHNGMTREEGGLPVGLGHGTRALRLQDGTSTTGSTRMTLKQWSGLRLLFLRQTPAKPHVMKTSGMAACL